MIHIKEISYGDERYKEEKIRQNIKSAKRDGEVLNQIEKTFGKERMKEIKNEIVPDCVRYGIDDPKDIVTVAKLCDDGIDKMDAIRAAKSANEYGDTYKMGAKESEELDKTLLKKARKNKNVQNEEQAVMLAQNSRDIMDRYTKMKSKI